MSLALPNPVAKSPTTQQEQSRSAILPPILASLTICAILLIGYLFAFKGDWSSLVCLRHEYVGAPPFEKVRTGFPNPGYDGQFYYSIARNPWKRQPVYLDSNGGRHLRLLYPALAWTFSGGDPQALFFVMPMINVLAIVGLTWLGARVALQVGQSPWLGLLLPIITAAPMPMLRNLTDPVSLFCAAGLLIAWTQKQSGWSLGLWGLAAMLSREQNIAIVGALFLIALVGRRRDQAMPLFVALLAQVGWIGYTWWLYGKWPFLPTQGNLGLPLGGFIAEAKSLLSAKPLGHLGNARFRIVLVGPANGNCILLAFFDTRSRITNISSRSIDTCFVCGI